MKSSSPVAEFSPGILSLLPLFYVGWSDSVLSPTEMKLIHSRISQLSYLSPSEREYLIRWTDPTRPPGEEIFQAWMKAIVKSAAELHHDQKLDLVQMGIEMGKAGGAQIDELTVQRIHDVADMLGVSNSVSAKLLGSKVYDYDIAPEESFNVDELLAQLDGVEKPVRDRMRQLLRDDVFAIDYVADKEKYRLVTLNRVKSLANQGVSAYSFPKIYGGGESRRDHMAVFEMLAYSDLSTTIKFGVQFGLFGGAVFMLGTEKHHRKYVEPMHRAELLGCFAMTETGHGSNVKGLETTATYDAATDELIIHSPNRMAGKEYIGNALHSTMAATFCQLIVNGENHGVHAVLVPLRNSNGELLPGIEVEDCGYKMGLNGVDNGRIWYRQVRVPRENLLNRYGDINDQGKYVSPIDNPSKRFFTMLGALVVGRICIGLAGISASKKALTIAVKYALQRRQFAAKDEDPETIIMDYPTHQERLIPLIATNYAYHFALRKLADQYATHDGDDMRKIETLAAGLKSKATWLATRTIQECREACGGKGYLAENQFTLLKGDTDIFTTFEGDNTVLMQLVAKGVLTEFKQSFHDDSTGAVIRVILKKINHVFQEINPITRRNTDSAHLRSHDFIKDALQYRYDKILISLSERMRKFLNRKIDPYEAFLRVQIHMVDLAHVYIDQIAYQALYEQINVAESKENKAVLLKMSQLFGLDLIYNDRGWYLENDFISGSKSKAIRRVRMKLIQELRPEVSGLVEAFGIPDELIAAPIVVG